MTRRSQEKKTRFVERLRIARIVDALNRLHDKLPNAKVITALEVTAGQGTTLGHRFEHLAAIIEQVEAPQRLAVCLDTAHLIAAGYNLTSRSGAQGVLREADRVFGLDRVKVIHINDSKAPRGSRVDRHEHIGHGHVSPDAFAVFLRSRRLRHVPFILETPKQDTEDGRPWDAVNLRTLRELANSRSVPRKST